MAKSKKMKKINILKMLKLLPEEMRKRKIWVILKFEKSVFSAHHHKSDAVLFYYSSQVLKERYDSILNKFSSSC